MPFPATHNTARPHGKLASIRPFFSFGWTFASTGITGMMTAISLSGLRKSTKVDIFGSIAGSGNRPPTRSRSAAGKTPSLPEPVSGPPSDIVPRINDSGLRGFSKGAILPVKNLGGEWP